MGSKRWMLRNGLGHLLDDELPKARRFFDLFTGSSAVVQFAARHPVSVHAFDLQQFSVALAKAVVLRAAPVSVESLWRAWQIRAKDYLKTLRRGAAASRSLPGVREFNGAYVERERAASARDSACIITRAYGGHYYSRAQALWLDALRATLPSSPIESAVALAALVRAASLCAASPGHTAQPFQPTVGAKRFLFNAWTRDVLVATETSLWAVASVHAQIIGSASVADANTAALSVQEGDLVFLDPPYSGVHYSRFYHVLETVARGTCGDVTGVGRYPPEEERPRSDYSLRGQSAAALTELLASIAKQGGTGILTFPEHECSNGLSGDQIQCLAERHFRVQRKAVENRFSTLGGTKASDGEGYGRAARQKANELIFVLRPR